MKPTVFHPEATMEMVDAARFYEERVEGLGEDFLAEVVAAEQAVQTSPNLWPPFRLGSRRYLLHRFPYSMVYWDLPDHIWILAIAHASRRPLYWKSRVGK